ncbi:glycosyltransferase family protein [Gulbenkiania mobilis]|uniref:Glycosyltransferase n=1 Tax=Gulbenkiania mobilis TaxID=397457 RepID=A0ABY2CY97_GULMO|nr:hypothetical protein EV669_103374 [Gulbenkiania mobilis]
MRLIASIVLFKNFKNKTEPLIEQITSSSLLEKLILVDNGGCNWASNMNNEKIVYIKPKNNIGFGAGHNIAISRFAEHSDFFLIVNPDIEVSAEDLDAFCLAAEKEDAALFMPDIRYPNGERQHLCKLLPTPFDLFFRRFLPSISKSTNTTYELHDADYSRKFFAPYLSGCFMLVRSTALKAVGGFDERFFLYLEDTDLSRRLATYGSALYLPSTTVTHHFQKASYKSVKLLLIHVRSACSYFFKWGWFFDAERKQMNQRCLRHLPRK